MIKITTAARLKAIEDRITAIEARPAEVIIGTDRVELRQIVKQYLIELVPSLVEAAKSKLMRDRLK